MGAEDQDGDPALILVRHEEKKPRSLKKVGENREDFFQLCQKNNKKNRPNHEKEGVGK